MMPISMVIVLVSFVRQRIINLDNINRIGFYGDSFVWGQGLDLYDTGENYGEHFTKSNWEKLDNSEPHKFNFACTPRIFNNTKDSHGIMTSSLFHYGEDWIRYCSIVNRRWTTKVANHFKCEYLSGADNGGGNHITLLEATQAHDIVPDDIKIFILSHPQRDINIMWKNQMNNKYHNSDVNYFTGYVPYETKVHKRQFDRIRYIMEQLTGLKVSMLEGKNEPGYPFGQPRWEDIRNPKEIIYLFRIYYEALFECLKRLEDELEIPFRFIGSWCSEEYVVLEYYKNSGLSIPNFDWYLERIIPIVHNRQTFTSICDIWFKDVKDKYTISGDLPENFKLGYDEHPNQKLHDILANSVISYIEEKL